MIHPRCGLVFKLIARQDPYTVTPWEIGGGLTAAIGYSLNKHRRWEFVSLKTNADSLRDATNAERAAALTAQSASGECQQVAAREESDPLFWRQLPSLQRLCILFVREVLVGAVDGASPGGTDAETDGRRAVTRAMIAAHGPDGGRVLPRELSDAVLLGHHPREWMRWDRAWHRDTSLLTVWRNDAPLPGTEPPSPYETTGRAVFRVELPPDFRRYPYWRLPDQGWHRSDRTTAALPRKRTKRRVRPLRSEIADGLDLLCFLREDE